MNTDTARTTKSFVAALAVLAGLAILSLAVHGRQRVENPIVQNDFVKVSEYAEPTKVELVATARNADFALLIVRAEPTTKGANPNTYAGSWKPFNVRYVDVGGLYGLGSYTCCREFWLELHSAPAGSPFADDAVRLDPKHNEVLLDNQLVRVVRVHFPPGESGPMVDKRARVIIMLTDSHATVTLPDGHSEVRDGKTGTVSFSKAGRQATNNVGTTPLENIVVELKSK